MKANPSEERSFYTQGQQFSARVLFIAWLLASVSPEGVLAAPKRQMVPAATASPGEPSLASTPPTPPPGGTLQSPSDSSGSLLGDRVAIDAAPQRQPAANRLPRTIDKLPSQLTSPRPQAAPRTQARPVTGGSENAMRRAAVYQTLWRIAHFVPSEARDILPTFKEAIENQDSHICLDTVNVLGKMVQAVPGKFSPMIQGSGAFAKNPAPQVRPDTVDVFEKMKRLQAPFEQIPYMIPELDNFARNRALEARLDTIDKLGRMLQEALGQVPAIFQESEAFARSRDTHVCLDAIDALREVIKVAPSEAPAIIQQIFAGVAVSRDQHYLVRLAALNALEKAIGAAPDEAPVIILILINAVENTNMIRNLDEDKMVLKAALGALRKALEAASSQAPKIIESLLLADKHDDYSLKQSALQTLEEALESNPSEAPRFALSLIDAAQAENCDVRQAIREPLLQVVQSAPSEAPALRSILLGTANRAIDEICETSLEALQKSLEIASSEASQLINILLLAATYKKSLLKQTSLKTLDTVLEADPSKALSFTQRLIEAAQSASSEVGKTVLEALRRTLEAASSEVSQIIEILLLAVKHKDASLKQTALKTLETVLKSNPSKAPSFTQRLIGAAKAKDGDIREAVQEALLQVVRSAPSQARTIRFTLMDTAKDAPPEVRKTVLEALKQTESTPAKLAPQEVRQALKAYYQEHFFEVPSFFPEEPRTPMGQIQCHLMLLEQVKVKEVPPEGKENQLMAIHERIEWRKSPIALCDLFKKRSIKPDGPIEEISKVLLIGEAGTGKTTLSRKIAHDWAQGAWGDDFTAVYLLPVRNLQQGRYDGISHEAPTLATAIVRECFAANLWKDKRDFERLRDQVQEELKHPTTLVILDGLDERAGAQEKILNEAEEGKAGSHKLLLLSRPYGVAHERQKVEIEIEHEGFDDRQMDTYVQGYFQKRELSEAAETLNAELLTFIKEYPAPKAISHVPVNLEILCALWRKDQKGVREATMQGSLPGLYRRLTAYMWERFLEKYQDDPKHQSQVAGYRESFFTSLRKIALSSLEEGNVLIGDEQVIIDDHQVQDALGGPIREAMLRESGLLQAAGVGQYQFPHLTFQEYFAGCTLAGKFLSENKRDQKRAGKFLSDHKYESQYGRTLSFMAGEVSRSEGVEGIQDLLTLLRESDQELVGLQHLLLQLRVVHEWLCMSGEDTEDELAALEDEFHVLSSLEEWFVRAFAHVRLEGYEVDSPGYKLLALLSGSLQTFRSLLPHAPFLLTLLRKAIQDPDKSVRRATCQALANLAPVDAQSLALLHEAVGDPNKFVRHAAVEALANLGHADAQSLTVLRNAMEDADEWVSHAAVATLGTLGTVDDETRTTLYSHAKNPDSPIHEAAFAALGKLALRDEQSLALLHEAGEEGDMRIRQAAFQALGNLGTADARTLLVLHKGIQDTDWQVRRGACQALGSLGAGDEQSLTLLRAAAKDKRWPVLESALQALGHLASGDERTRSLFHEAAKNADMNVRCAACRALGNSGTSDKGTRAILLEAAKDKDENVRYVALQALANLATGDEHTRSLLLEAAKEKYWNNRALAFKALGKLGTADERTRTLLYEAAAKGQPSVSRSAALQTLGNLKPIEEQTLTLLREAVQEPESDVRLAAFAALGTISPGEKKAQRVLLPTAKSPASVVRASALQTLGTLGTLEDEILTVIRSSLKDESSTVRHASTKALGKLRLDQHIEAYWATKDPQLLPYITHGLYHLPLVAHQGHLKLYMQAGKSRKWSYPHSEIERFASLIKRELSKQEVEDPNHSNRLAQHQASSISPSLGDSVLDAAVWARYFGEVGSAPALPSDIAEVMNGPCPFWAGQRVRDTHLLALIPGQVAGKALTLDYLGALIKSPRGHGHKTQYRGDWYAKHVSPALGSKVSGSSYWVLMTKDVLPGSRYKSYADQRKLLAEYASGTGLDYSVPSALEAAVVVLLHHVRSGECLYSDNPLTYTRCRDKIAGYPAVVGGFSSGSLHVNSHIIYGYDHSNDGISGLRKF